MGKRAEAAKELIESIMDNEIETQEILRKRTEKLDVSKDMLKRLARNIYKARVSGKISKRDAKRLFAEGFTSILLLEYTSDVGEIKDVVDSHIDKQAKATTDMDAPLRSLAPILKKDIKARLATKNEQQSAN